MNSEVLFIIRYVVSLSFGTFVTFGLSGIKDKLFRKCVVVILLLGVLELTVYATSNLDYMLATYPAHTHLVLMGILIIVFKCKIYNSIMYTLLAYMSCQIPAWISKLSQLVLPGNMLAELILYTVIAIITSIIIIRYVGDSAVYFLGGSLSAHIAFGIIPVVYYLFDYITTVWTNILYDNEYLVVQFMPLVVCVTYMVIITVLKREQKLRMETLEVNNYLGKQLSITEVEIKELQEIQDMARIYRHDMRHNLMLIYDYLKKDEKQKAMDYINENVELINAITPKHYCENGILNLLLSRFATIAQEKEIKYYFDVKLPQQLPISDIEVCTMLSNAFENTFNALSQIETDNRYLNMLFTTHHNMLIFSLDNACDQTLKIDGTVPKAVDDNHGYGTRSIALISTKHGGDAYFKAEGGMFKLMVTIPLKNE